MEAKIIEIEGKFGNTLKSVIVNKTQENFNVIEKFINDNFSNIGKEKVDFNEGEKSFIIRFSYYDQDHYSQKLITLLNTPI